MSSADSVSGDEDAPSHLPVSRRSGTAKTADVARLPAGRKSDPAWAHVDVDPSGDVWWKKCQKLIQSTGKNHVERVKRHLNVRCAYRSAGGRITDTYKPKMKTGVLKKFHQALKLLNVDAETPTREQLAGLLLEDAYQTSVRRISVKMAAKIVTLVTDAWTDICGLAVVNYIAVSGDETFFLESVYTGDKGHDAAFIAADVTRVIMKYAGFKVGGVVTDNMAANKAAWTILQEKFPRTFFHGCVCHALHLVKDFIDNFKWLDGLRVMKRYALKQLLRVLL